MATIVNPTAKIDTAKIALAYTGGNDLVFYLRYHTL
jgi:hypothetical protein